MVNWSPLLLTTSKLINAVEPDTIPKAKFKVREPSKELNRFEVGNNLKTGLDGARKLGVVVINVDADDFIQGTVKFCLIFTTRHILSLVSFGN